MTRETDFNHAPPSLLKRLLDAYKYIQPIDTLLEWAEAGDRPYLFNELYLPEDEELLP